MIKTWLWREMSAMKRKIMLSAVVMCVMMLSGCTEKIPANTVFSIDDLEGKTIGVQLGTVGDSYASDIEGAVVERFSRGEDAVMMLKQGNIDAVLIDAEPAKLFAAENSDLTILEEMFAEEEYAIAVSKDNKALTARINDALAELQEDGTLDAIKENWIGDKASRKPYKFPQSDEEDAEKPKGTLVMATNAEFPPFELMDGEDIIGLDADMMKAVCDRMGMELVIANMEFDEIITAVNLGHADVGVAAMTITEDRLEIVDFSDPYTTSTQVVIVRKK